MSSEQPSYPLAHTIDEVAQRLRLTRRTIQTYLKAGKIKSTKLGGAVRIPASELTRILDGDISRPTK